MSIRTCAKIFLIMTVMGSSPVIGARSLIQANEASQRSEAPTSAKLEGPTIYEHVKKGALDAALRLLKADKTSQPQSIDHWWLAKIALARSNFKDFQKHIAEIKDLPLLKNTKLARELYEALPPSQQAWLSQRIANVGYFETPPASPCPYFELKQRRDRGEFLFLLQKNHRFTQMIENNLFHELYVVMPEVIDINDLRTLPGFTRYEKSLPLNHIVKRMEHLILFGKNIEARKTFDDQKSARTKPVPSKTDLCELEFVDAKIDRKQKKYDRARARFKDLSTYCPTETEQKARYLDLMLASQRGDETALSSFAKFVERNPTHGFSDDVLLFKANLLFDKNRIDDGLVVLDQIIASYPKGDMIERALFLKGFHLAKRGKNDEAIKTFNALHNATIPGQLERAQATYWIARLTLFPHLYHLQKSSKPKDEMAQAALFDLAKSSSPNVYSWLAVGLLSHLDDKRTLPHQKTPSVSSTKKLPSESKELDRIEDLIVRGFRDEALALLDDMRIDENKSDFAIRMAMMYDELNNPAAGHQKLIRCNFVVAQNLKKEVPHIYQKISFPRPFTKEVAFARKKIDVPEDIIFAIMRQESGFLPDSVSWAGAKGLMQLMYASALSQAKTWGIANLQEDDLYSPEINILLATSLLQNYWQQFGSIVIGLAAYNAGPNMAATWQTKNKGGNLDVFIEDITFKETRDYVKAVVGNIYAYMTLNAPSSSVGLSVKEIASIK